MALFEHDDDKPATSSDDPDAAHETKGDAKKKHKDNMLIIGIALVGVILTYLIYRSNKTASSSSPATPTSGAPVSGTLAGGSGTTNATDPYAEAAITQLQSQFQQQGSALAGLQSSLSSLTAEVGSLSNSPSSAPPQSPSPVPASPGYGFINLPGIGQSVILGQVGTGQPDYQVGGGAPVYFGNASGVSQGTSQETPGNYAYTPVGYGSLVSAKPGVPYTLPGQ